MRLKITKFFLILPLLCAWLLSSASLAGGSATPLPAEQAFVFSATVLNSTRAVVEWRIAPGYYLYAKRIHLAFNPDAKANFQMPQGDLKYDAVQGRLEIFSNNLTIPIQTEHADKSLQVRIDYQGCSQDGFCYPPMQKNITVDFKNLSVKEAGANSSSTSWLSLLTDQEGVSALLSSWHLSGILLLFFGLGLLLAFTPCCLPMVPILTGLIVGQRQPLNTKRAFTLSLIYVLGSAITYACAGILAAVVGSSLQIWLQKPFIIVLVSLFFMVLAASLFGLFEIRLPNRLQNKLIQFSNKQQGGSFVGVFVMGIISTLIISPCVSAPLVGVLLYISQTGDMLLGGSALFVMGFGMGIPLLLIGSSAGKWLPKTGIWMEVVKELAGFMLLAMGAWLLSRVVDEKIMVGIWCLLLMGFAYFISIALQRFNQFKTVNRAIGLIVAVISVSAVVSTSFSVNEKKAEVAFTIVHDLASLNQALAQAQAKQKPVLLDFYADWCESCVVMDKQVFSRTQVKQALKDYVLLRADLTAYNANDQAIMKQFNIIAPPSVVFFAGLGNELKENRIVGEVNADEFLARLARLSQV